MNTVNGNFIEKSIPDNSDATINVKIGNTDSTMNLVDFQTAMAPTPAYKVYTALLTQSGGGDPTFVEGDGELQVGRSYEININNNNIDFTPYGAPNNNIGTKFVCTVYFGWIDPTGIPGDTQLLYNTGAPVVTVLENTIGNVWFTYVGVGDYYAMSDGLFTINKSINTLTQTSNISSLSDTPYYAYCTPQNANELEIVISDSTLTNSNDLLYNKLIEIRVYN